MSKWKLPTLPGWLYGGVGSLAVIVVGWVVRIELVAASRCSATTTATNIIKTQSTNWSPK